MMVGESGELIDGVEGEDAEDAEEVGDLVWLCHLFKFSIHHILFWFSNLHFFFTLQLVGLDLEPSEEALLLDDEEDDEDGEDRSWRR